MKHLPGLSILVVLLAAVIVLTGQQTEVKTLLGPKGQQGAISDLQHNPIVKAQGTVALENFNTLFTDAKLELTSNPSDNQKQLAVAIGQSEPQLLIGKPLAKGGTQVTLFRSPTGALVRFCSYSALASSYHCEAGWITGPKSGKTASASANTLAAAEGPPIKSLQGP